MRPVPVAEVRGSPHPRHAAQPSSSRNPPMCTACPPRVLCDVCCEQVPPSLLRGCAACNHRYCAPCVDKYWTGAIYSGNHARLLCMYGGCGVFATDADIASVVTDRTFRKMLYFRSRDAADGCPTARWCARDLCWEFLGMNAASVSSATGSILRCPRCSARTCVKCEREVTTPKHVCPNRKHNRTHAALFGLWATVHTKACPACAARIQRNHGCSHMTCTRCSSYFCWRCKGFLNNGCPLPGRACICDRVMTAAAYSGLAVGGIVGLPVIVTVVLLGGPPYLAYRVVKAKRGREARANSDDDRTAVRIRSRRTARSILQPDEMIVDEDFESGSTRFTGLSEVGMPSLPLRTSAGANCRIRVQQVAGRSVQSSDLSAADSTGEANDTDSYDPLDDLFGSETTDDSAQASGADRDAVAVVNVESCKSARPFVLERRRGSVSGGRLVRRSIL